jgi:hypothetical protein
MFQIVKSLYPCGGTIYDSEILASFSPEYFTYFSSCEISVPLWGGTIYECKIARCFAGFSIEMLRQFFKVVK